MVRHKDVTRDPLIYVGRGIIRVGNRLKNQYFFSLRSSALILNANRSTTPIVQRSSTE
jgi:hypothetical protein